MSELFRHSLLKTTNHHLDHLEESLIKTDQAPRTAEKCFQNAEYSKQALKKSSEPERKLRRNLIKNNDEDSCSQVMCVCWNAGMVMPGQIISLYENYMFRPNYGIQHYVARPGAGWCAGLPHD